MVCQLIYLNLICHSDNNLLYYENKSLAERFPERVSRKYLGGYRLEIKSILRGHIPNVTIYSNHILTKKLINCNIGKIINIFGYLLKRELFIVFF